ncbi:MAG: HNH endonuclease [Erysipelotrichia bacterium]|nr:HNH endonuclease [Erysipelotrichia bacterium]
MTNRKRANEVGKHRVAYDKNKQKILATQSVCAICGKPVDKSLKYPHPLSATIDHIVPLDLGGHPSDIANLQLTHWTCNRQKYNKLADGSVVVPKDKAISNRVLPQSINWMNYKAE